MMSHCQPCKGIQSYIPGLVTTTVLYKKDNYSILIRNQNMLVHDFLNIELVNIVLNL